MALLLFPPTPVAGNSTRWLLAKYAHRVLPPSTCAACRNSRLGAHVRPTASMRYFAATPDVAEPPALLFAVMFCGFTGQFNWPLKPPAPLFVSVPIT